MKLSSTTFLRISALILVGVGAYGIYSWQMKQPRIVEVSPAAAWPWYYYGIPLMLTIIFGWFILARHTFTTETRRLLAMLVLFAGVAYFGVKTFDTIPPIKWTKDPPAVVYQPSPQPIQPQPVRAPIEQPQPVVQQPPPRTYSYEECWKIASRAYNNASVPVPPDCQQAWQDYKQRQEEIAEANRHKEAEAQEARERELQAQQREADRQRRIAEQERRDQARAEREAQYERDRQAREEARLRREKEREQERKRREWEDRIRRIIRRP